MHLAAIVYEKQNGYSTGRLTGVNVGADGVVKGSYSNGQARNLGQVVLANFTNRG